MKNSITKLEPEINPTTFKDGRGIIKTYYPHADSIKEWNYIITNKGHIRGFHYHPEFDEYIMLVEGEGIYTEIINGNEVTTTVSSGECIHIPSGISHTLYPITDCKMIAMITKKWDDCETPLIKTVSHV